MARKIKEPKSPTAAENPSAALAELNPNIEVTIAGRAITFREYGFFEGLEVAQKAQPLIAAMRNMFDGGNFQYLSLRRAFAEHRELVIQLSAQSADVEPNWVRGLECDRKAAGLFIDTWFGVNSSFFMDEVVNEMREDRVLASIGTALSQSSPAPASATSIESADSPSGS